ncbi:MAG TPA: HAD family hydrolase [Candidatus Bilamarchaeum sp.]|nr:HAD family hydrolase [Candidatus Bilamarchaeum sp.]
MKLRTAEAGKKRGRFPVRCVILDFDGTLTDVEKEAAGFGERYLLDLCSVLGIAEAELGRLWEAERRKLDESPDFGWSVGGKIVAPAYADPHILATATAGAVLDSLGLFMDKAERLKLSDSIFHRNYPLNPTVFRDGAGEFLRELMDKFPVFIVTSSEAGNVERKLAQLGPGRAPPVFGSAQKYAIDDSWAAVPEGMEVGGLGRPVLLRRKKYWEIIEGILASAGVSRGEALVAGDIFELDLSLPLFMGVPVCLVMKGATGIYEIDAVSGYERGIVAPDLQGVLSSLAPGSWNISMKR